MIIAHWILLGTKNSSDKFCRENQNTRFIFNFFFQKIMLVWDNADKYCRARLITDGSIIRRRKNAIFVRDNYGKNTNTVIIFYCFCSVNLVKRTRLSINNTDIACLIVCYVGERKSSMLGTYHLIVFLALLSQRKSS